MKTNRKYYQLHLTQYVDIRKTDFLEDSHLSKFFFKMLMEHIACLLKFFLQNPCNWGKLRVLQEKQTAEVGMSERLKM